MSKCIKCGRELTSGEIPEFNDGMCDKCYKAYQCEQYPLKKGIYDMQEEIKQLKQQLDESFTEKDVEGLIEDRNKTIKFLQQQLAEKDKEINSLIIDYEKRISQEQELMSNLEKQLAEKEEELLKQKEKSARTEQIYNGIIVEKDKEIEKLNKTLEMCKHIERYDIGEMFLENAKLIIEKRQFAIQKLEKVKINLKDRITMMCNKEHSYLQKVVSWYDICNQVNKQIKELKGE